MRHFPTPVLRTTTRHISRRAWGRGALLAAAVALSATPWVRAADTTATWGGSATGNWSVAANWTTSNGATLPPNSATTDAVITTSNATVTLDQTATVGNLTLGSTVILDFNNAEQLTVSAGTISNAGNINLLSTGSGLTQLNLGADTMLTGGGTITLQSFSFISGAFTLTNVNNTIQGEGSYSSNGIGKGDLTLINQTAGIINANVNGKTLIVYPGAGGVTNTGLMEATNGGILQLSTNNGGLYTNTGGTITASGAGSIVNLVNGVSITGGILSDTSGGIVQTGAGSTASLTSLTNANTFVVQNGATTTINGAIVNDGTINLNSTGSGVTSLVLGSDVTLTGGGTITIQSSTTTQAAAFIKGAYTLTNTDNTIEGEASYQSEGIGQGDLTLINQTNGVINADNPDSSTSKTLIVDPGAGGVTNTGLMEATNGGVLQLSGAGGGAFTNTGGTIKASGTGSVVNLVSGAAVTGGILTTASGGIIQSGDTTPSLTGLTINGNYVIQNSTSTTFNGAIVNEGNINLNSTGNGVTRFILGSDVTLTGGGTITIQSSTTTQSAAFIQGAFTLTNTNNTIEGEASYGSDGIGQGDLTLINQTNGVINANNPDTSTSNTLIVYPGAGGVTNTGLMEATNGGVLQLQGGVGAFNNTSGTIKASGANSVVNLINAAAVSGGQLTSDTGGVVQTAVNNTASLSNLTNNANFVIQNDATTTFNGAIVNNASILLNSNGYGYTYFTLGSDTTLTGGGTITLESSSATGAVAFIDGAHTLTNVDNTIEGEASFNSAGIGAGDMTIVNEASGVIDANNPDSSSSKTLVLYPGAANATTGTAGGLTNLGLLEATNGGILELNGGSATVFTNTGGKITASGSNSMVYLFNNASVVGGTLTTDTGGIIEVGTPAAATTAILSGLTNKASIYVQDASTLKLNGAIVNQGSILLNSNGSGYTYLTLASDTTLSGGGTVTLQSSTTSPAVAFITGAFTLTNVDNTIEGEASFSGFGIGANDLAVVNEAAGTINANNPDSSSSKTLIIFPGSGGVSNLGTFEASNGGTLLVKGDLAQDDAATAGILTAGTYEALTGSTISISTPALPIVTIGADAVVVLSGTGSTFTSGGATIDSTLATNDGELHVLNRTFNALPFTNAGLLQLGGGGSLPTGGGIFNAPSLLNTGTIEATGTGNVLSITAGITDPIAGVITVDAGGSLDISGGGASNSTVTLNQNGSLNIGANNITVSGDYTNANFDTTPGNPNTFNKHANVTGTGQILAAPGTAGLALLSVSGTGVSNGTTATPTISGINAHVGVASTYSVQLNNNGTAGTNPTIRGAIQNTGVTDSQLSVAAADYVLAPGANTSIGITFTPTAAGPIAAGQTVHIANNFDNVTEQTVTLSGAGYALASTDFDTTTVTLPSIRVGGAFASQSLSVDNTLAASIYNETLGAQFANGSGVTTSGSPITVVAGAPASTALTVSLPGADNATAGVQSGTVDVQFNSQAVNGSGLGTTSLAALNKTVTVSASVYNVAVPNTLATPVNLGIIHPNQNFANVALSISNNAPTGGFSEGLDAAVTGTGGGGSYGGSIINLAAGSSNTITIGLANADTSTAGGKTGTVTVGFSTDGATTSGLAPATITGPTGSQTVTLNGQVNDYASPAFHQTAGAATLSNDGTQSASYTLDFGTQTALASGSATLSLENLLVAADAAYQDSLGGTFTVTSGAGTFQLSGFSNISDAAAIAPGSSQAAGTISFANLDTGTYSETLTFTPNSTTDGLSADSSIPGDTSVALNITLNVTSGSVPEPASLAILGLGAAALLKRRRGM